MRSNARVVNVLHLKVNTRLQTAQFYVEWLEIMLWYNDKLFSIEKDIIFPEHGLTWTVENRDASCYIVSCRQNKQVDEPGK